MKRKAGLEEAAREGGKVALDLGYEVVETALDRENAGTYLRFYLDKPGGITLSDCEAFHRKVQPGLEKVDYDFLEVCSPGLDRPLKTRRDLEKALGAQVEVRLYKPQGGAKEHRGELAGADETGIRLRTAAGDIAFTKKEIALIRRSVDLSALEGPDAETQEEAE